MNQFINLLLLITLINTINALSLIGLPQPNKETVQKPSTDPEIFMTCDQIIERWGYPVEKYDVTTDDGYILTIFRIPHGRNLSSIKGNEPRPVVFLQHGLECSSYDWVTNLPNEDAGYLFADNGFDVWLGNFRGNMYGLRHTHLSPKSTEFWSFSFDEMAHSDLPAMINFALNVTQASSLFYVGHSMGTTAAFAKFSRDQEFNKKIKTFYALAPAVTVKHIKGPLKYLAPLTKSLDDFFKLVGYNNFLPDTRLTQLLAEYFCSNPFSTMICDDITFLICGPESHQMNTTRTSVYIAHTPGGTSTQTVAHYGQMINNGKFEMYDFGWRQNKKKYGQDSPPQYDVTQIEIPVYIFWGSSDWLADEKDVESLIPKLRNLVGNVFLNDFNHLDFLWGLRAAAEIYWPIIEDIRQQFFFDKKH